MHITCSTSVLQSALAQVGRAISSQQTLPILGNILLEAKDGVCTMSATDLELSIVTKFAATVQQEGSITIPAKALQHYAQYTSDPEITLKVEGTHVHCQSARSKTQLLGEKATEYPRISSPEEGTEFSVELVPLLEALQLTTFSCSRNSLRPVLSGVLFTLENGKLLLAATDSFRLSETSIDAQGDGAVRAIVPVKVLEELRAVMGGKKDKEGNDDAPLRLKIRLHAQQASFSAGDTHIVSRLIEGSFPPYTQIIPKERTMRAHFVAKDLLTAVRRMHYFAKEMNNTITFALKDGKALLSTPETPLGKDEAELSIESEGGDTTIALSSSYLLDFLSRLPEEGVMMEVQDSMHPAVFRIPTRDHTLHLIMPLRLSQ